MLGIAIQKLRYHKALHGIALITTLIFIIISFRPPCLFAGQGDTESIGQQSANTTTPQKLADEQKYPAPDEFVIVDKQPVLKYAPEPEYPEEALIEKIEGTVWVKVLVDSDGKVIKAFIAKGPEKDMGFEESALRNAKQRKYEPAEIDGKPVAVWIVYKIQFKLK